MALIKCPDCGKMLSEFAECCPQCGCPIEDVKAESQIAKIPQESCMKEPSPMNDEETGIEIKDAEKEEIAVLSETDSVEDLSICHEGKIDSDSVNDESVAETKTAPLGTVKKKQIAIGFCCLVVLILVGLLLYSKLNKNSVPQELVYLSNDLATFELYGSVKSVRYNLDSPIVVEFDEWGNVDKMYRIWNNDETNITSAIIKRNDNGQIIEYEWGEGYGWYDELVYSYNNGDGTYCRNVSNHTYTNRTGNSHTYIYIYDDNGTLISIESFGYIHGEALGTDKIDVQLKQTDSQGNWIERTFAVDDEIKMTTRTITYYTDLGKVDYSNGQITKPMTFSEYNDNHSFTIELTPPNVAFIRINEQDVFTYKGTFGQDGNTLYIKVMPTYDYSGDSIKMRCIIDGNNMVTKSERMDMRDWKLSRIN